MLLIKVQGGPQRMDTQTHSDPWLARGVPQPHSARHDPPEPFPDGANQRADEEAWLDRG